LGTLKAFYQNPKKRRGMNKKQSLLRIEEYFASEFRNSLRKRYGKIPSASFIAIQFNRRVTENGITQESARRWVRGLSMPSYSHLQVIIVWLDLSIETIFGSEHTAPPQHSAQIMEVAEILSRLSLNARGNLLDFVLSMDCASRTGLAKSCFH
jgi:hypothetical protein